MAQLVEQLPSKYKTLSSNPTKKSQEIQREQAPPSMGRL
jgi:hypothetical protein